MRKKSIKRAVDTFKSEVDAIHEFVAGLGGKQTSKKHQSMVHEYAIIRLYRVFEELMLVSLAGLINQDTNSTLVKTTGIKFPTHMSYEAIEYIVTGGGYFDFRGRDGLIGLLRKHLDGTHWFVAIVKDSKYKDALDKLCALRNYAAHGSPQSKQSALAATGQNRIGDAGAWLKSGDRFPNISGALVRLANELKAKSPI